MSKTESLSCALFLRIFLISLLSISGLLPAQSQEAEHEDAAQQANQWFARQRAYPNQAVPGALRLKALQQLDQMVAAQKQAAASASPKTSSRANASAQAGFAANGTWHPIGPQPILIGPTFALSGRVDSIAVDPRNSNVVYAGTDSGGVWKSTDAGNNWKPLTDTQPSLSISFITLDPNNPDTIWAGTGGNSDGTQFGYYGSGFLKSTDGGSSWTNLLGPWGDSSSTLGTELITSIAIQPGNSNVALATVICNVCSVLGGVYRTTDGGNSWTSVLNNSFTDSVVFDPTNSRVAYLTASAAACCSRDIFKSTDGGLTWSNLVPGQTFAKGFQVKIRVAPSSPSTLYVLGNGFAKSTDGGAHWTVLSDPGFQTDQRIALAVSPADPNLVFAGGVNGFFSRDGGQSWIPFTLFHSDYHAFTFDASGNKLFLGGDGGIFSVSPPSAADNSDNWMNLNATLQTALMYPGMAVDDSNPNFAIVGTQDNGTIIFSGAMGWAGGLAPCGDGGTDAIGTSSVVYVSCLKLLFQTHAPLFKSTNSGQSFQSAENGIPADETSGGIFAPLEVDPSDRNRLYLQHPAHLAERGRRRKLDRYLA